MKLSIVIPCYNEEKNIPILLEKLNHVLHRKDVEVIFVDNGSTDHSVEIFDQMLPSYPFAKRVVVPVNQGYGYGILQGLKACTGTYIGWTHADLQTDPSDIVKALELLERKHNPKNILVKGNRKGRPFFDQFFTIGMSLFESLYLGEKLWDINAQPNIFPRTFFEKWENPPYDFSLDLYVLYMAYKEGLKVLRFDVLFPKRMHGSSSWNTGLRSKWKFIKRTLEFSKKQKKAGMR